MIQLLKKDIYFNLLPVPKVRHLRLLAFRSRCCWCPGHLWVPLQLQRTVSPGPSSVHLSACPSLVLHGQCQGSLFHPGQDIPGVLRPWESENHLLINCSSLGSAGSNTTGASLTQRGKGVMANAQLPSILRCALHGSSRVLGGTRAICSQCKQLVMWPPRHCWPCLPCLMSPLPRWCLLGLSPK